jgi:osmoprotectant transport system permease protein
MNDIVAAFVWMAGHGPVVMTALKQHVLMSAVSLAIGALIALPLGAAVAESRMAAAVTINSINAIRTIPSLAILAAALPFLGIGFTPSVVALVVLAIPPILINTCVGLREVEADVVDAATGIGMTGWQRLRQIKLPLAAPAVVTGIRLAAIQVISGAALASFIGGGGFGDFITAGIAIMDVPRLLAGAIPIAAMAFLVDGLLVALERKLFLRQGGKADGLA